MPGDCECVNRFHAVVRLERAVTLELGEIAISLKQFRGNWGQVSIQWAPQFSGIDDQRQYSLSLGCVLH